MIELDTFFRFVVSNVKSSSFRWLKGIQISVSNQPSVFIVCSFYTFFFRKNGHSGLPSLLGKHLNPDPWIRKVINQNIYQVIVV
jgi:hypothetical protein